MKAAATLPAPTPMKSRSTSVSKPPSSANERVVAEVWVITMRATARALGSSRQTRWAENVGACSPGRPAGSRAEGDDSLGGQIEGRRGGQRQQHAEQRAGQAAAHALAGDDDGEDRDGDGQRVQVGVADVLHGADELLQRVARRRRQAEHCRELADDDGDRDAGEKAGDDRHRQEVGDPAHARHADRR